MPAPPRNPHADLAVVATTNGAGTAYTIHREDCRHANTATAQRADFVLDPSMSGPDLAAFAREHKVCGTCKPDLKGRKAGKGSQTASRRREDAEARVEARGRREERGKPRKRTSKRASAAKADA